MASLSASGEVHVIHASVADDPHEAALAFGRRAPEKLVRVVAIDDTTAPEKSAALMHLINLSSSQQDKAATVRAGGVEACAHVIRASSEEGVRALAAALLCRLCTVRLSRDRLAAAAPGAVATLISMAGNDDGPACRHAAADVLATITAFGEHAHLVAHADGRIPSESAETPAGSAAAGEPTAAAAARASVPPAVERLVRALPGNARLITTVRNLCGGFATELLSSGLATSLAIFMAAALDEVEAWPGAVAVGGAGGNSLRPPAPLPRGFASDLCPSLGSAGLSVEVLACFARLCTAGGAKAIEAAAATGAAGSLVGWLGPSATPAHRRAAAAALAAVLATPCGERAVMARDVAVMAEGLASLTTGKQEPIGTSDAVLALCGLCRSASLVGQPGSAASLGPGRICPQLWSIVRATLRAHAEAGETASEAGAIVCRHLGPAVAWPAAAAVASDEVEGGDRALASALLAELSEAFPEVASAAGVRAGLEERFAAGHADGVSRLWGPGWSAASSQGGSGGGGSLPPGLAAISSVTGAGEALLRGSVLASGCGDDATVMRLGKVLVALCSGSAALLSDVRALLRSDGELKEALEGAFAATPALREAVL